MLILILLLCALVCFILDTIGIASRVNLTALGLAFLTITMLIGNGGLTHG